MIFKSGDKFSKNFTVSPEVYNGFIELFNDHNPLHVNEQFAMEKGFKERIMHGNILNGFISHFIGESLPTKSVIIHSQEIQFKNVVFLNDELKFNAVISRIYEAMNIIVFEFEFKKPDEIIVARGKIQIGILK